MGVQCDRTCHGYASLQADFLSTAMDCRQKAHRISGILDGSQGQDFQADQMQTGKNWENLPDKTLIRQSAALSLALTKERLS